MSTPKFKRMMELLTKGGLQGRRHAICWEISKGRTESSKELTALEVDELIERLEKQFAQQDKSDKMRKKMISYARQMQWEVRSGGSVKCDMDRLNAWCIDYGMYHKELNKHTYTELTELLTQFEKVYKHYLKSI